MVSKPYEITSKFLGIPIDQLKRMDISDIEKKIFETLKERGILHVPSIPQPCPSDPFYNRGYPIVTEDDLRKYGIIP